MLKEHLTASLTLPISWSSSKEVEVGPIVQVIVTCDTALVVNAERAHEPQVQTFIEDLQHRLALAGGALSADPSGDGATSADSPPRSGAAAHVHDNTDLTANGDVQEVGPGGHEPPEALEVPRDEPHDSGAVLYPHYRVPLSALNIGRCLILAGYL